MHDRSKSPAFSLGSFAGRGVIALPAYFKVLVVALVVCGVAGVSAREPTSVVPKRLEVDWHDRVSPRAFLEYSPRERALPAVEATRGWVFVADRFGKVRSFDARGKPRWSADVGGRVEAGPVVNDGRLFVVTVRGRVLSFDAFTGEERWTYRAQSELATTPTVADGRLLVPGLADTLLALDADSGEFLWFYRRPRPDDLTIRGATRPVVQGERVLMGFSDGTVLALSLDDGDVIWTTQAGFGEHRDVIAPAVVREDKVYVASYSGSLHALDVATGRELWMVSALPGTIRMIGVGDRLITASAGVVAGHRLSDGATLWETKIAGGEPSELTAFGDRVCVGTDEGPLTVLSATSGRPISAFDGGSGAGAGGQPDAMGLWLFTNGGWLYRLSWPAS